MERRSDGTVIFHSRREAEGKMDLVADAPKVCVQSVRNPDRVMVIKDRRGPVPRFEDLEREPRFPAAAHV